MEEQEQFDVYLLVINSTIPEYFRWISGTSFCIEKLKKITPAKHCAIKSGHLIVSISAGELFTLITEIDRFYPDSRYREIIRFVANSNSETFRYFILYSRMDWNVQFPLIKSTELILSEMV